MARFCCKTALCWQLLWQHRERCTKLTSASGMELNNCHSTPRSPMSRFHTLDHSQTSSTFSTNFYFSAFCSYLKWPCFIGIQSPRDLLSLVMHPYLKIAQETGSSIGLWFRCQMFRNVQIREMQVSFP